MCRLHQKIEQLWWSDDLPPLLLRAASHVYRIINRHNLNRRERATIPPSLPMISIGNITAGGSGKTPFVIWLVTKLKNEGFQPVILCRGDGGNSAKPELLADSSDPQQAGDEAVLLYQKSGCPVISGKDRVHAAQMAQDYGNIIIFDDGFQYRQLERTCDIVLIPAEGVGNGHLIPAGPLRESVEALKRADLVIRTGRASEVEPLTEEKEWRWWCDNHQLEHVAGPRHETPGKGVALTAIARPGRFLQSLEELGVDIVKSYTFPDHHPFSAAEIEQASRHHEAVIVTSKDAVKLRNIWPADRPLWVLEQSAEAEAGLFEAIEKFIR
ncbi:MAG: tetraacyldisaccharide 4'-kinase [Mariprofundaceae bacterium]|nr:tetraacyldisaccharide 4'-kinase [Mariprofundaceae bacterium]